MSSPSEGRSLELYYIDGRPDGMLTAEIFNWTGHVLKTPRTQLGAALRRPESAYAGVYLLFGEQTGEARVYIGEGEDISARIKSHDVNKDWWTSAALITTAGNKLNKAHARYLEARLIAEARKIARTQLDNGTNPVVPTLSEADTSKMEAFLEYLFFALPALGIDAFSPVVRLVSGRLALQASPTPSGDTPRSLEPLPVRGLPRFYLANKKLKIKAYAVIVNGEFTRQGRGSPR